MKVIISENILKVAPYFNLSTTDTSYYDTILNKPEYSFWEKGLDGELKYMTPKEYFMECAFLQKTTLNDQLRYIDKEIAQEYKKKMVDGVKFPIGVLDFDSKTQEGRHRAFAVQLLNPHLQIPILTVNFYSHNFRMGLIEKIKKFHTDRLSWQQIKEKIDNLPLNENYLERIIKGYFD